MGDEKDDIDSQIHQGLRTLSRRFVVEYVRSGIDYPDEDRSDSAEAMSMTYAQLKQALMALVNYIQGIITGVMWRNIGPDKFSQPMLIKINDGPESVADDWMQQILSQRSNLPDPDEATDDSILRFECTDLTSLFHQVAYQLSHSWLVEHMKEPDPDLSGDTVSQPLKEEADRSQQGAKGFADDTVIGDELDEGNNDVNQINSDPCFFPMTAQYGPFKAPTYKTLEEFIKESVDNDTSTDTVSQSSQEKEEVSPQQKENESVQIITDKVNEFLRTHKLTDGYIRMSYGWYIKLLTDALHEFYEDAPERDKKKELRCIDNSILKARVFLQRTVHLGGPCTNDTFPEELHSIVIRDQLVAFIRKVIREQSHIETEQQFLDVFARDFIAFGCGYLPEGFYPPHSPQPFTLSDDLLIGLLTYFVDILSKCRGDVNPTHVYIRDEDKQQLARDFVSERVDARVITQITDPSQFKPIRYINISPVELYKWLLYFIPVIDAKLQEEIENDGRS